MKILMLSDVYFPRVNGVSTSMRTFARELQGQGHAVTIVAPDYPGDHADDEFDMVRLASRTIFFDPEDRLINATAMREAAATLTEREWDIIHIHTPFRAHQLGVKLSQRLGCPTVETYHTFFEQYAAHYLPWVPASFSKFAARHISRRLSRGIDHMIVPTQQMADVLTAYGIATPTTVIPTGIHLDEFSGGDGARFRRDHGIAADQPTLVTVSRLAAEKNIGFLLSVTSKLIAEFPNLVFIVAGEGPDAARLQRQAEALGLANHVRFVGNLDRRGGLLDCYKAGDVFVFASPTETQGLVLIEAMALGVPIVSTAVMGTAAVLEGMASARISDDNVAAFASHVAALLRSPDERRSLAAAGPADAQKWSATSLMGGVVDLYTKLTARR